MGGALQGKTALVTGAASGIGLAIAREFSTQGAHVVMVGRRQQELRAAAEEVGEGVSTVAADVSNLADLDHVFSTVRARHGHLDVVVANAGTGSFAPLGQITEEQYDTTFATNVKGTVFTVQKALPLLRPGSSVIIIGSTASVTGNPAFSVYGASKAAVRGLVRHWAQDLRGSGIRVNVLSPGSTDTPGLRGLVPTEQHDALLADLARAAPLERVAAPCEVATAALFLASDASSFVQGAEFFVDGGLAQV